MSVVVIGIGNRDRGDDGIGPVLADELDGRLADTAVIAHEGDLSHLPLLWSAGDDVLLVDAVVDDDIEVGELRPLDRRDIASGRLLSTHGIGLAEALDLADRLGHGPGSLRIVGIGAHGFEPGPMDARLRERIPALVDEIVRLTPGHR